MGACSSQQIHTSDTNLHESQNGASLKELRQQLKEKDAELERLRRELESIKSGAGSSKLVESTTNRSLPTTPSTKDLNIRRGEVSAEVLNQSNNALDIPEEKYEKVVYPKSDEVRKVISAAVDDNVLFQVMIFLSFSYYLFICIKILYFFLVL